jgi:hypothetical protein
MTILDRTITLTFTHEEALSLRIGCNETGSGWTSRAHEAREAGLNDDADTFLRIAARYSAIWDRIAAAMNAPAPAPDPRLAWFDDAPAPETPSQFVDRVNAPDWRDRYGRPLVERDSMGARLDGGPDDEAAPAAPVHNGFHPPGFDDDCEACQLDGRKAGGAL